MSSGVTSTNKPQPPVAMLLLSITALAGTILAANTVSADDNTSVVDEINITVPISCTLSGTGMNTHNANINNGQYNSAIGETTLKAFCNDNEGFAIYAIGYTDNEDDNNVLTNSTLGSTYDIETGTAITGNDSQWAMKLSTITSPTPTYPIIIAGSTDDTEKEQGDPDYSTFQEVPDDYAKVAYRTSSTDIGANAEGSTLKTTYQAYISQTQAAGTYTGQVKYTLVHPSSKSPLEYDCEAGKICYSPNANDVVGSMGQQELIRARDWSSCAITDYETICLDSSYQQIDINTLPELDYYTVSALYASNFKREGYGFAGWNDKYDMTGTNYGPNQSLDTSLTTAASGLSLYAHWVESSGNLQGWTGCSALNLNQVIGLTDTRDGNVYAVTKLADGNCWMMENLRLDNTANTLNSTNTNNPMPDFTSLAASSDDGWDCSDKSGYEYYACMQQNRINTNNTTLFTINTTSSQDGAIYSYGNYYNWYTATAGHGTVGLPNGNVTGSICPSGWQLPSSGNNGQFYALNTAINSGATNTSEGLRAYPANFIYSGEVPSFGGGSVGVYYSSTADSSVMAYQFEITNGGVTPSAGGTTQDVGLPIRCLFINQ